MKKSKLLAVVISIALMMSVMTGCLESGSTSGTSGGTDTGTTSGTSGGTSSGTTSGTSKETSSGTASGTSGDSGSNSSSVSSGNTSTSNQSGYSDNEIRSLLEKYLENQGFHVSSVEIDSTSGNTVELSAYTFGADTYPRIGVFKIDRTTGKGYQLDVGADEYDDTLIDFRQSGSSASQKSEESTSKSLSDSEICKLVYNYAIQNQNYDDGDGYYFKRSLQKTYVDYTEGNACLVCVDVTTYDSPSYDANSAGDGWMDVYWYNKESGTIKYAGEFNETARYSVDMKTGESEGEYY